MKRYDLDQGNEYHPAATMEERPEGDWCAYEDVVAEFAKAHEEVLQVDIRLKQEVTRLRTAMEDATRILLNCEERPTPNVKLIHDAWVVLRTALGHKAGPDAPGAPE